MKKLGRKHQTGFTLVEIAIVLVIVGLLLGGILKGQELINSAKVKSLANDFRTIPTYIYAYQDKFKSLPGDDNNIVGHLGGTATQATTGGTIGNGVIEGNWWSATTTDEWRLFNEPAVYVVDRNGIVRAAFELIFSDAELTAALDGIK